MVKTISPWTGKRSSVVDVWRTDRKEKKGRHVVKIAILITQTKFHILTANPFSKVHVKATSVCFTSRPNVFSKT